MKPKSEAEEIERDRWGTDEWEREALRLERSVDSWKEQVRIVDEDRASLRDLLKLVREKRDAAREWVRKLTAEQCVLTCVYCGHAYPPGTPGSNHEALTAHVVVCEEHPAMRLRKALSAFIDAIHCGDLSWLQVSLELRLGREPSSMPLSRRSRLVERRRERRATHVFMVEQGKGRRHPRAM